MRSMTTEILRWRSNSPPVSLPYGGIPELSRIAIVNPTNAQILFCLMSELLSSCPSCESQQTVKNDSTHHRNPNSTALACGRQLVQHHFQKTISPETKSFSIKLLLEKNSLAAIARVTNVSEPWLKMMSTLSMLKLFNKLSSAQKPRKNNSSMRPSLVISWK